ncbi:unnamed protein product [Caenorhabditis bovis]|uniref:Uncharacterized protein n=1 Tax=Caenorhabditis bovis TaxID=2654633 RepID=A0A8S1EFU6_9PELO|nr:unnamed protein product [Caenorhabditis bovis]
MVQVSSTGPFSMKNNQYGEHEIAEPEMAEEVALVAEEPVAALRPNYFPPSPPAEGRPMGEELWRFNPPDSPDSMRDEPLRDVIDERSLSPAFLVNHGIFVALNNRQFRYTPYSPDDTPSSSNSPGQMERYELSPAPYVNVDGLKEFHGFENEIRGLQLMETQPAAQNRKRKTTGSSEEFEAPVEKRVHFELNKKDLRKKSISGNNSKITSGFIISDNHTGRGGNTSSEDFVNVEFESYDWSKPSSSEPDPFDPRWQQGTSSSSQ